MTSKPALRAWFAAAAISFSLVATGPCLQAREFRAADNQVADYPTVQAIEHMARLVRERTGGRHNINVFHSGQLGEENETIKQTRVGAIDLNRINAAPLTAVIPELEALAIPFLFSSIEHLHRVLDGPVGEEILKQLDNYEFVGLTFYDSGARSIYTNRPVKSLADIKGLRIRVQNSRLAQDMVKAMGATPVVISYGQVLTSLATKLVDGAENNWPSYVTTDHFKVAQHYILTEHTMAPELLIMSRKAWETLDAEDQKIFKQAARESSLFMRGQWRAWEERSRKQATEAGNTIVTQFDRKPFVEAMKGLHAEAAKNPKLNRLIDMIRAAD
jgi:tripartite ATP-independent transporter DctP family solute receptor